MTDVGVDDRVLLIAKQQGKSLSAGDLVVKVHVSMSLRSIERSCMKYD